MPTDKYFAGKTCVVTGAASGIGFALTEALLRAGSTIVVMADRDSKALASAVEQLGADAGRVEAMVVDVAKQEQVQKMLEDTASRYGRLDFLCNNAGISWVTEYANVTLDAWRGFIDINLWGVIYGVHFALPIMRRQRGGHIVNISSICGLFPAPFQVLYDTTKYAVVGLSESLRLEMEEEGIHVSVVCPANVITPIFKGHAPADAIPAQEAAQIILAGVANKEGIIAFPEKYHAMWRRYWKDPEAFETELSQMTRERRTNLRVKGTPF